MRTEHLYDFKERADTSVPSRGARVSSVHCLKQDARLTTSPRICLRRSRRSFFFFFPGYATCLMTTLRSTGGDVFSSARAPSLGFRAPDPLCQVLVQRGVSADRLTGPAASRPADSVADSEASETCWRASCAAKISESPVGAAR